MVIKYAIMLRLRLIDFLLDHYGTVNRAALVDFYGISIAQASADIKQYLELAPGNCKYDSHIKAYVRTPGAKRIFP